MPLSLPIIGIAVSLSLHLTVSWIIQLLADLRFLAASELKSMLREVDLIETLASIQVAIMFICFYCWVRELCFFENLFAYNEFGACDQHVFQTESEDIENGLRSGDQKDASSYNALSGSINFDIA